jgi:hypothetical protein
VRPVVGPADFLRVAVPLGADASAAKLLARLLGYDLAEPLGHGRTAEDEEHLSRPERDAIESVDDAARLDDTELLEAPAVLEPMARPADQASAPRWWADTSRLPDERPGQAWHSPDPEPLFDPARRRDILRTLVDRRVPGRRIDFLALTGLLARREPYAALPMRLESRVARSVAVVARRSPFVETFARDVLTLDSELRALVGRDAVSVHWFKRVPEQLPSARTVLLVEQSRADVLRDPSPVRAWLGAARSARATGTTVHALVPETLAAELWNPLRTIEWSRRTRAGHLTARYPAQNPAGWLQQLKQGTRELATLLSPAVRIEPALMRRMRLRCLPGHGPEIEAALRTSPSVEISNSLGIALAESVRRKLLAQLKSHARRDQADAIIRSAHEEAAPVMVLEETLLRLLTRQEAGWQLKTVEALREVTRTLSSSRTGLARWVAEAEAHLPSDLWASDEVSEAFAQAKLRASAILQRTLTGRAAARSLPHEVATFLLSDLKAREEVELRFLDPSTRPVTGSELGKLSAKARASLAECLRTSERWLSSSAKRERISGFRGGVLQRELERRTRTDAPQTSVLLCHELGDERFAELRSHLEREPGFSCSVARPRDARLDELLASADVVVARLDELALSKLLERAQRDPTFMLCLLDTPQAEHLRSYVEQYAEVIDHQLGTVDIWRRLRQLLVFAGRGKIVQLRATILQAPPGPMRLAVPAAAVGSLTTTHTTASRDQESSVPSQRTDVTRTGFQILYEQLPVASVHVPHDIWIARLYGSACRVFHGSSKGRTGCFVDAHFVITATAPDAGGSALRVGDQVELQVGGESRRLARVAAVSEALSLLRFDERTASSTWLRSSEQPSAFGPALAVAMLATSGPAHLFWGIVDLQEDRTSWFVLQTHAYKPGYRALFGGASILIEGRYVGQVTSLEQRADGRWAGRVYFAPSSLFLATPRQVQREPLPLPPVAATPDDAVPTSAGKNDQREVARPTAKAPTKATKAPTKATKAPTKATKAPTKATKAPTKAPRKAAKAAHEKAAKKLARKPARKLSSAARKAAKKQRAVRKLAKK